MISNKRPAGRGFYLPVRGKLVLALLGATLWCGVSTWLALPWITELATLTGWPAAWGIVGGVALVPGFASAFVLCGLLEDRRPLYEGNGRLPPMSILIAAYNEEDTIALTLESILRQNYPVALEVIVVDDGSTDSTADRVRAFITQRAGQDSPCSFHLLSLDRNGGKANALNQGLARTSHDLIATIDADSCLFANALRRIASNIQDGPPSTAAVAGTVLVRNSRNNWLTRLQEWDYFLGISIVKRAQSLFQGTLVAQGAFSVYRRDVLREVGGWPDTVGEDIVLTWAILRRGLRVGYAENAFVFTNVPITLGQYFRQRKRWARGLIEAFKRYPGILAAPRANLPFVYMNLLFPYIDFAYLFFFLPGVLAAIFFQFYAIAGTMTIMLLPLTAMINLVMFHHQRHVFRRYGLTVRRNHLGWLTYAICYQIMLSPASLAGYLSELAGRRKVW